MSLFSLFKTKAKGPTPEQQADAALRQTLREIFDKGLFRKDDGLELKKMLGDSNIPLSALVQEIRTTLQMTMLEKEAAMRESLFYRQALRRSQRENGGPSIT